MVLVKLPVPEPSVVLLSAVVGLWEISQQRPLEVTADPLSSVTLPPETAVFSVIPVTPTVIRTGTGVVSFSLQDCRIGTKPAVKKTMTVIRRKDFMVVRFYQ